MEERFKKDVENFQNVESRIMGEFKGTKGEWTFDDIDMKIKGTGGIEGRTVIANVSPKMGYSRGMTTQCANAQLIAAAPELLVELFQITLLLKALPENDSEMVERIESAEKTIKKALGL